MKNIRISSDTCSQLRFVTVDSRSIRPVELVKIRNENIEKFTLNNKCMYVRSSTVLFLFEIEHYVENIYFKLWHDKHVVNEKYKQFVTLLQRNNINNRITK